MLFSVKLKKKGIDMTKKLLINKINTIWDISVQEISLTVEDYSKLYVLKENESFNINLFADSQKLYTTLKTAVISEWLYRNFPEYSLRRITIEELCSHAHSYQKDEERIKKKVIKCCKKLLCPTTQNSGKWSLLYSELNNACENSSTSSIYSYNTTYQIICNWNQLLNFVENNNQIEIIACLDSLIYTLAANTFEVSGSKTGLGCIAPDYIMQEFYEDLLCPYFFFDLFSQLINMKIRIENKIKKEVESSLNDASKYYRRYFTDPRTAKSSNLETENIDIENHNFFTVFKYKYSFLQIIYFNYLYAAVQIGKYPSYIMKNYYHTILIEYFNLLFLHPHVNHNYTTTYKSFNLQLEQCNNIYRKLYSSFSDSMTSVTSDIKAYLKNDISLFDLYFETLPKCTDLSYFQNKGLFDLDFSTDDIKAILSDLFQTKKINYETLPDWDQYYSSKEENKWFNSPTDNYSPKVPISEHFLSLTSLIAPTRKEKLILYNKLSKLHIYDSEYHIVRPNLSTSNLKVSFKK